MVAQGDATAHSTAHICGCAMTTGATRHNISYQNPAVRAGQR